MASKTSKSKGDVIAPVQVETITPAVPVDPIKQCEEALEAEKENAARVKAETETAARAAQEKIDAQRAVIVMDWEQHNRKLRTWLADTGAKISAYLSDFLALHGVEKRKEGIDKLIVDIFVATEGEANISDDVSRALLIHNACLIFGRGIVTALPMSAQKGIGSLLERVPAADGKSESYILPTKIATEARIIVAAARIALNKDKVLIAPVHIEARFGRTKEGIAGGINVYDICKELNAFAKGKGANPFTVPVAPADPVAPTGTVLVTGGVATAIVKEGETTTTTTTAVDTTTTKTQEAGGAVPPPLVKAQDASGNRADDEAPAGATIVLDRKPAIAAAQLLEALFAHNDSLMVIDGMMASSSISWDNFVGPMLNALSNHGLVKTLAKIANTAHKEAKILEWLAVNTGESDPIKARKLAIAALKVK